ncbi:MAG: PadR family transcriptional regulator [Draconibacterium sp.]|nr:PadR family transcriptional regulator [Draconibacterium sp.]
MSDRIGNKEIAVLGLLSERPMHGYDLEHEIRMRDMRYWTEISMSSVYKVLKKLEEKGLVTCEVKLTSNNVAQKVYSLSELGKVRLNGEISAVFTEFDHQRWDIDLAVSNLNVLTQEQKATCLNAYIHKLKELLAGYGELQKYLEAESCPVHRMALAIRPQYLYKAEIEWAEEYLKTVTAK